MRGGKRTRRARRPQRLPAPLSFERLEPRLAMAVVINEFVASNVDGITDQDGDRSDWIELKNTDAAPVDLTGWYLTDESANLTKWQLPATNLPAGEYLTIFASDKNRAVAGQELHTNFQLADEGEYLGLVMADGTTVAHEFASFPAQFEDVSYGIGVPVRAPRSTIDLVRDNAPAARRFRRRPRMRPWTTSGARSASTIASWIATTTGVGFRSRFGAKQCA